MNRVVQVMIHRFKFMTFIAENSEISIRISIIRVMAKFNVNIAGSSGSIFMGDQSNITITNDNVRLGANRRPVVSITPGDPAFRVRHPVPEVAPGVHGQETQSGDATRYLIRQGFALLIHNQHFPSREDPKREGSEMDAEAIQQFCDEVGVRVNDTYHKTTDLTAQEIKNLCDEISKRDFSHYDAFLCFILSHGKESGILGVDNDTISVQKIVAMFKESEGLKGKPKLFFVQACRGSLQDSGVESDSHVVNKNLPLRLPTESDILIAHSTVKGYEAYRNREVGSWFIMTLIEKLRQYAHERHLMDILTLVNNQVATQYTPDGLKQMPCQLSTLTKFVYFNYPPPLSS